MRAIAILCVVLWTPFILPASPSLWEKATSEASPDQKPERLAIGSGQRFEVAMDMIARQGPNGITRFERIPQQKTPEELSAWIAENRSATHESPRVLVYEKDGKSTNTPPGIATREIVFNLDPEMPPQVLSKRIGAEYIGELSYAPGSHRFLMPSEIETLTIADKLVGQPGIKAIHPQIAHLRIRTAVPNDPFYPVQWHLRNNGQTGSKANIDINVEGAWDSVRGRGVTIGIVDDGILADHPDLAANVNTALGYDFRDHDNNPSPNLVTPNQQDPNNDPQEDSHGTLVAGVAAARGFNGIGGSGVAPEATLVGIRLIGDYITDLQEAEAIGYRHDLIAIKNNSWGPIDNGAALSGPNELAQAAIIDAIENGRNGYGSIFLWAAGNGGLENDNSNKNGYANSIYTIAVGALDENGKRAEYSERGANILISAPVGNHRSFGTLTTDLPGDDGLNINGYETDIRDPAYTINFYGTSSATPMVSGIVALMLEANPSLGWRDVQEILVRTARKTDASADSWLTNAAGFHFSNEFGAGLADASAAVTMARTWTNLTSLRNASSTLRLDTPLTLTDAGSAPWEQTFSFKETALRVEHATVSVFIDHPMRGELRIELESPSGTVSQLVDFSNDDSRGYFVWTFSSPQFWGESAAGLWRLRITDGTPGNIGELWQATITLHGTETVSNNLPASPRNLTATPAGANAVALHWEDRATNETAYRLEFSYGWGNLWTIERVLPANTTSYVQNHIRQGVEIYYRVVAIRNDQESGYSNIAAAQADDGDGSVLFQSSFEPSEGYSANTSLHGDEWIADPSGFTYPAQGIAVNAFGNLGRSGQGQQAFIGGSPMGGKSFSSVFHFDDYYPSPGTALQFSTLVSLSNSTNGRADGFGFNFLNQEGYSFLQILFDNSTGDVLYASLNDPNYVDSSLNFSRNRIYTLNITMDFETLRWSASLDSMTIANNRPLFPNNTQREINFGSLSAFWYVFDPVRAGNNRMYFDDISITQIAKSAPPTPSAFSAEAVSDTLIFLQWEEDILADNYEIQRRSDTLGWNTIATIPEDAYFYLDTTGTPNTAYQYRMRAMNNRGYSGYTSEVGARTYTPYETWKDRHRFDIKTPDENDDDGDGLPLLMEYALVLSPKRDSSYAIPWVNYEAGKLRMYYYRGRNDINYTVQSSTDMLHWTSDGVTQIAETLGLYVTAEVDATDLRNCFLRLLVTEK